MADLHNNTITLSDNLKVTVEVGEYGKFIRFTRKEKWISLNEKTWLFLKNNIPTLSTAFKNGIEKGIKLTTTKNIKVGQFKGSNYIMLSEGKTFIIHLFHQSECRRMEYVFRSSDFIAGSIPITMCTVSVSCLFICLFMNVVSKLFFKMHLFLQISTDPFDITHESSLEGSAFGLCSAWRYGAFWRFGDHQQNSLVYSDATN